MDSYVETISPKNIVKRSVPLGSAVKVHVISDLHCDRQSNVQWWKQMVQNHINESKKEQDERGIQVHNILIIPGDISHQLKVMENIFMEAKRGYDDIFFIPGNHEMWCTSSSNYTSSLDKCKDINTLCDKLSVSYYPVYYPDCNLLIAPIWSWYHASWDTTRRKSYVAYATANASSVVPFEDKWVDFHLCKWPTNIDTHDEITSLKSSTNKLATYFASFNELWLERFINGEEDLVPETITLPDSNKENMEIISFSHFVPLQELIPTYLFHDELRKVSGSNPLKNQIHRLKPNTHVFGHTHLPVDETINGIRYLQWPLGTGEERLTSCSKVDRTGPLCVYDNSDEVEISNGFLGF